MLLILSVIVGILVLPGLLMALVQSPIAAFHPDLYEDPEMDIANIPISDRELSVRRKTYEQAVEKVNKNLVGTASNYGLGWGVLAALDLMAYDDEVRGHEFAELLRSHAKYMDVQSVATVWKRSAPLVGEVTATANKIIFNPKVEGIVFKNNYVLGQDGWAPLSWSAIIKNGSGLTVWSKHGDGDSLSCTGQMDIKWTGKNNHGNIVAPGVYTYYFTVNYTSGSSARVDSRSAEPVKFRVDRRSSGIGASGDEDYDYNLEDFYVVNTVKESEKLVTSVDTYKGVYVFEYEQVEEPVVTALSEDGIVTEVTVNKKHVLRNILFEPDLSRLKEALKLRWGGKDEHEPVDGDVVFAEEWGMRLQKGIMDFTSLDAATSFEHYNYQGGPVSVYMSDGGFVWPVEGYYTITSRFGIYRDIPSVGVKGVHRGIDIGAPTGTKALAVTRGMIGAIYETSGGGRSLRLDGYDGCSYLYLHLDHWAMSHVGMQVEAGDVVAAVGNTGKRTTGSHLHFEVHVNGTPVDPVIHCGWSEVIR